MPSTSNPYENIFRESSNEFGINQVKADTKL